MARAAGRSTATAGGVPYAVRVSPVYGLLPSARWPGQASLSDDNPPT